MTKQLPNQPELPGLEVEPPAGSAAGPMRTAMSATLGRLQEVGALRPEHAAQAQLALLMADVTDRAMDARTKVYAAVNAGHEMHEQIMALPMPVVAEDADSVDREIAVLLGRLPE